MGRKKEGDPIIAGKDQAVFSHYNTDTVTLAYNGHLALTHKDKSWGLRKRVNSYCYCHFSTREAAEAELKNLFDIVKTQPKPPQQTQPEQMEPEPQQQMPLQELVPCPVPFRGCACVIRI